MDRGIAHRKAVNEVVVHGRKPDPLDAPIIVRTRCSPQTAVLRIHRDRPYRIPSVTIVPNTPARDRQPLGLGHADWGSLRRWATGPTESLAAGSQSLATISPAIDQPPQRPTNDSRRPSRPHRTDVRIAPFQPIGPVDANQLTTPANKRAVPSTDAITTP